MGKDSGIAWTGRTWNPTTGCDRVSAGCNSCYALVQAGLNKESGGKRYQNDGDPVTSGPGFGLSLWPELISTPKQWVEPEMIFVNSMSDLFHARVPIDFVAKVFKTMDETPRHTYQVLTKRAARLPKIVDKLDWPDNLWMGVSVEDEDAMSRIEQLKAVPTGVRFLSCEPLIGPLPNLADHLEGINWVIVGGESGEEARPLEIGWLEDIRDACKETGTSFFFKQFGSVWAERHGWSSKKGEDPSEWDEEWKREFPT